MAKTNFNDVKVDTLETARIVGGRGTKTIAVDTALTDAEKATYLEVTASAASKVLTLGLGNGEIMFLKNAGGTNAFTAKNIAGDTGVSVATGKTALCVGGTSTANTFVCTVLNQEVSYEMGRM